MDPLSHHLSISCILLLLVLWIVQTLSSLKHLLNCFIVLFMVKYLDSFLMAKGEQHFHLLIMDVKLLEMEMRETVTTFNAY